MLNEIKSALIGLWKSKGITIDISDPLNAKVQGNRLLLFQSFRNVLQNAVEFSHPDSSIQIQTQILESDIKIEIVDQGTGIPDFANARIFEKFYSLERPDTKRKSSGLGLSFVKEVIELHKGQIEINSPIKNNSGTAVVIKLPRASHV